MKLQDYTPYKRPVQRVYGLKLSTWHDIAYLGFCMLLVALVGFSSKHSLSSTLIDPRPTVYAEGLCK